MGEKKKRRLDNTAMSLMESSAERVLGSVVFQVLIKYLERIE